MFNLSELVKGGTVCLSKAGLAEGTNSATIKTNAPNGGGTDFAINGKLYYKADTDNLAVTALALQADLTTCLYTVALDSGGNVTVTKGTAALTANLTAGLVGLTFPEPAANCCPIGGFKIVTSGGTFTAGTTDFSASGITATCYDFMAIPDAPIVA